MFHSFLFGCIVAIASWTGQHCIDQGREATSNKFAFHIEAASEQKLDRLAELSECVLKSLCELWDVKIRRYVFGQTLPAGREVTSAVTETESL